MANLQKREEVLRPLAKENLKTPTGGRGLTSAKLPESKPAIDTRKEAAKTAGVGARVGVSGRKQVASLTPVGADFDGF